MDCTGNEKHCDCMDCSYNRAEENYNRLLDNEEYYEDWGWGFN
jgi:hypothetical protein